MATRAVEAEQVFPSGLTIRMVNELHATGCHIGFCPGDTVEQRTRADFHGDRPPRPPCRPHA